MKKNLTREDKLKILERINPFVSSSAGDPLYMQCRHVASVNQEAFDGITRLIRQKIQNPFDHAAVLALGEVGDGKTHLIARLADFAANLTPCLPVICIQPLEDHFRPFGYLLREILHHLCRPTHHPAGPDTCHTFLLHLIALVLKETFEKHLKSSEKCQKLLELLNEKPEIAFNEKKVTLTLLDEIKKRAVQNFVRLYPSFPRDFMKILLSYQDTRMRHDALNRMKSLPLDDETIVRLGIHPPDISSIAAQEQDAKDMLTALGALLGRYNLMAIVCFDRLENLETDAQIRAFGKIIEFLVDVAPTMTPVVFFRGSQWLNHYRVKFNQHVVTRLEANTFELVGCAADQALEIILSRLQNAFDDPDCNDLFPFEKEALKDLFKDDIQSPREIITQANYYLKEVLKKHMPAHIAALLPKEMHDPLFVSFQDIYRSVLDQPDRHLPSRHLIQRGVEIYLDYTPPENGFQIESLLRPEDAYIDFTCNIRYPSGTIPAVFIIDVETSHQSVKASLKRGVEFLHIKPNGRAFFLRDGRHEIQPTWKGTLKMLKVFEDMGGLVFILNPEQASGWYALAQMASEVKEEHIVSHDPDGHVKTATWKDFETFVRTTIHQGRHPIFEHIHKALTNH